MKAPHTFRSAAEAIAALAAHERQTVDLFQYELRLEVEGPHRDPAGYRVRIMDLAGFLVGFVEPPAA